MQPKHVGIILDGNRRYAQKKGMLPWKGHVEGRKNVRSLLEWAKEYGVEELTLFAFSVQNFNRPQEEVEQLFSLLQDACKEFLTKEFNDKHQLRVRFIGRLSMFPEHLQMRMKEVEEATEHHSPYKLNMCVAYGGREELTDAFKKLALQVQQGTLSPEQIDEELISSTLWLSSKPDMIIRTSGEHRTSNFLLWQSYYAEWFFVEKLWPEFSKEDFKSCLDEFSSRQRRFGA